MSPPDDTRTDLAAGMGCGLLILSAVGACALVAALVPFLERLVP